MPVQLRAELWSLGSTEPVHEGKSFLKCTAAHVAWTVLFHCGSPKATTALSLYLAGSWPHPPCATAHKEPLRPNQNLIQVECVCVTRSSSPSLSYSTWLYCRPPSIAFPADELLFIYHMNYTAKRDHPKRLVVLIFKIQRTWEMQSWKYFSRPPKIHF